MSCDSTDAATDIKEWVVVSSTAWWKTSFRRISWAFPTNRKQHSRSRTWCLKPIPSGSGIHARPPHYHDLLYRTKWREPPADDDSQVDTELDRGLPGVAAAEKVVMSFEIDVGFLSSTDAPSTDDRPLFRGEISEEDLALVQKRWNDQVQGLLGGVMKQLSTSIETPSSPEPDIKIWDLTSLDSPLSASSIPDLDQANSEHSVDSEPMPTTPRGSYASLFPSGEVAAPHPSKPLNATAMSFVPSVQTPSPELAPRAPTGSHSPDTDHSPSPTHEFAFPSLCADNPAASPAARKRSLLLQKDREGFYHPVDDAENPSDSHAPTRSTTPRRPSADLLPAFLADSTSAGRSKTRNASRTREMVDRLRSGRWNGKKTTAKTSQDVAELSSSNASPLAGKSIEKQSEKGPDAGLELKEAGLTPEDDGWIRGPVPDSDLTKVTEDSWIPDLNDMFAAHTSTSPDDTISVHTVTPPRSNTHTHTLRPPRTNAPKQGQKHGHKRSKSNNSSLGGSASGSGSSSALSPATPLSSLSTTHGPHTPPSAASSFFPPTPGLPASPFASTATFASPMAPQNPSMAQYMQMHAHIQQVQVQQWQMHARNLMGFYGSPSTYPYPASVPAASVLAAAPVGAAQPMMYAMGAKGVGLMGVR